MTVGMGLGSMHGMEEGGFYPDREPEEDSAPFPNIALEGPVTDRRATVRIGSVYLDFASVNGGARVVGRSKIGAQTYDARACWVSREEYREAKRIALKAIRRAQRRLRRQHQLTLVLSPAASHRPFCV